MLIKINGKICVATDENRYLCTDDAAKANAYRIKNSSNDFDLLDLGVEQTVSGTTEETQKVKEVIKKMEDYFMEEVLAKPEYAPIRGKCLNRERLCAFWASVGECDSNRPFMIAQCTAACRLCLQSLAFS